MLHQLRLQVLMSPPRAIALAIALIAGAACAPSTTVDQVWTSPRARTEPPFRKVVTIFITDSVTMRHAGEDHLAQDLAKQGIAATPGYAVFGNDVHDMRNVNAMKSRLLSLGYDGVVTMRVVARDQEIEGTPGTFDAYWGYWGPGYWGPYWSGAYWPGYAYTETIYRLESAAYSLRDGQLVWSALTSTVDPSSTHQLVDQTSEVVASRIARSGLAG